MITIKPEIKDFRSYVKSGMNPPGWGYEARRAVFRAACKYLGIDSVKAENIFYVGFHSVLNSSSLQLSGQLLDKAKNDPKILSKQNEIIRLLKSNRRYKKKEIEEKTAFFSAQLGGDRAKGEMWKQLLEVWKWADEYSATWKMAFNELTWTVRTVQVFYKYKADANGKITIKYNFEDTLDLRASSERTMEYNAVCTVLGFLYHDVLGSSDTLKINARWTTIINQ